MATPGLIKSINPKNKMHTNILKNPTDTKLLADYKRYKIKLTQLIKIARIKRNEMEIDENINSGKILRNTVNKLFN